MSTPGNGSQQQERLIQSQSVHCLYSNMDKGAKSVEKSWEYKNVIRGGTVITTSGMKSRLSQENCSAQCSPEGRPAPSFEIQDGTFQSDERRKQESVSSAKTLQWLAERRSAGELGVGITASRTRVKASDAAEGSCHNIDIGVSARHMLKDQDPAMSVR